MSNENLALIIRPPFALNKLDRGTRNEVIRSMNQIVKIGEITRTALDEISTNVVTAGHLGAQALAMSDYFATIAPNNEATKTYLHTLSQHYLHRMGAIANLGNDAIIQTTGKLCS